MSNAYFLSVLGSGIALLLLPAQATRDTSERYPVRSAQQEESRAVDVDIERNEPEMDIEIPDVEALPCAEAIASHPLS